MFTNIEFLVEQSRLGVLNTSPISVYNFRPTIYGSENELGPKIKEIDFSRMMMCIIFIILIFIRVMYSKPELDKEYLMS